ncbi:nitrous oxide reductase [Roseivirga sp. 4D4]|uniref:nitrous oxide reductase family maturation protein NosD n=1 Tax=Roseivirga sp. 4D4 TaxID=1889784 RepID=UPI000853E1AB|nr:nitrous oxide reductase family maturation protein NosD [Roseivirga sp. 4D4]OEK02324.1 nitrous oxide reductase [Roseivirga sp. 4D4]
MRNWFLTFLLFIISIPFYGGTIEVCQKCNVQTLEEAYAIAEPYDTLIIRAGTYEAIDFEVRKPLTLIGDIGAVLDGKSKSYILKILSDDVHVLDLKLINAGRSYTKDFAAIYVSGANRFSILRNTIIDPFFGILIEKSHHGKIASNVVESNRLREDDAGNGVHAWHCTDLTIEDNELSGLRDGIYLEFVEESLVTGNNSHNNIRYGLHFMFSNHDKYLDNTFRENGAGVAVMFSKFIEMRRNRFVQNWGTASYGLLLKEIYDAEVVDNTFEENTIGIFIEGCTRVNYLSNDFRRNGWAVKVSGGSYTNVFSRNNFLSNSFDVSYNSKMNDNKFEGNYWSSYSGYDLDKDNIGDVPYRPVKLFSYVVNKTPETIILLRSLFVDIINFSERVSPVFTPDNLIDNAPAMKSFSDDQN